MDVKKSDSQSTFHDEEIEKEVSKKKSKSQAEKEKKLKIKQEKEQKVNWPSEDQFRFFLT
jgi:hypothetical protein